MSDIKNKNFNVSIGTAIIFVMAVAGLIYNSTIRINNIENTITICKEQQTKNIAEIAKNKEALQRNDVANAEIKTKLTNIEVTLAEIKEALKINHQ